MCHDLSIYVPRQLYLLRQGLRATCIQWNDDISGRRSQSLFPMCYAQAQRSTVTWTTCTFVLFRCFMPSAMRKYCDAATICERGVMYTLTVFIWKKTQLLTMLFQTYSLKISMQQRKLPPGHFD